MAAARGLRDPEHRIQAVCDLAVGGAGLVLVDERGPFVVVALRAIRLRSETPMSAARVFPSCLRS